MSAPEASPARSGVSGSAVALESAAWYVLVAVCVLYPLALDRRGMIDNDNYLDYFINGRDFAWTWIFTEFDSWLQLFFRLSTEEVVWLGWTSLAGSVLEPSAAVGATAVLLNSLVVLAVKESRFRTLALVMWLAIPFGFAVTGTYQIRQGLAFGLWLYVGVRRDRLVLGSVLAAMVHTTFSVVAVLALIAVQRKWSPSARLAVLGLAGLVLAVVGETMFVSFGGRRLAESAVLDPDSLSLNFLLGLLVVVVYPAYLALHEPDLLRRGPDRHEITEYLLLYVGIVFFLMVSFFVFPIGNHRLPYIAWLGLIPIVANFDYSQARLDSPAMKRALVGFGLIFSFLAYQAYVAAANDRYACALVPNCADVLVR